MGSKVGVFIVIRNLEFFGGQSYQSGYNFLASPCLSCYVPSCNQRDAPLPFHCRFQLKMDEFPSTDNDLPHGEDKLLLHGMNLSQNNGTSIYLPTIDLGRVPIKGIETKLI